MMIFFESINKIIHFKSSFESTFRNIINMIQENDDLSHGFVSSIEYQKTEQLKEIRASYQLLEAGFFDVMKDSITRDDRQIHPERLKELFLPWPTI